MIDRPELQNCRQRDAKFLAHFAPKRLLGGLTFFNTASGGPVEDKIGLRISKFRDQEGNAMPDEAQGRLSGFDFHGACFEIILGLSVEKKLTVGLFSYSARGVFAMSRIGCGVGCCSLAD